MLAPAALGDISVIMVNQDKAWHVGKDAFLACTQGVTREYVRQSVTKALFSGEGWFVYKVVGTGVMFVSSFGAIIRRDLGDGERYYVDNGHLVAWTGCDYRMERVSSGGLVSVVASSEGLACRFTGPGTVYMQTRNALAFQHFISGQSAKAA